MGLSPDPEKRRRQLVNLERGPETALSRHAAPAAPEPKDEPAAPADGLEVMPYEPPAAPSKPAAKPKQPRKRAAQRPAPARAEPEAEPEPRRGGGFLDGFFGR